AFWIVLEAACLAIGVRAVLGEMRAGAGEQAALEEATEQRERAERDRTRALAESDTRFRAFFHDSPVGLYRVSASGELQLANPALLKLLGYSSVEEMRIHRLEIRECPDEASHRDFLARVIAKGAMEGQESTWVRRDGTNLTLRESARAVRNSQGEILHIDGSAEDVTEHRQLEERYTQAQKVQAIGQLAGGIAHDFNNIITAVSGFADLLLVSEDLPEVHRRKVAEIRKASDRAASLTKQMLAFSRKQTLQPRVLNLNTVITELEGMLQRLLGEHIQIITDLATDLASTRVDASQIQQVILNLAVNARDAMPEGGKLTLETANTKLDSAYARLHPGVKAGDYVLLSVSDTGTGIRPEIRERLFEPFFTTKAPGTGTGLGLATCHGIVTQSGGHITVYSEVGCGSTFKVFLPMTRSLPDGQSTAPFGAQTKPSRGRETVLLVEDEPQVREFANEVLTACGYTVITTTNGREALDYCSAPDSQRIEIIVTDVVMPEMGGRELVRRVRKTAPNIPVIFTSGFTFDAIRGHDMLEPGFHFLSKPYAMAALAKKVREVLDEPRAP
ncbi:MAG TPA: ATP-binding protein, partial [Candidatus Didemnitutus sp.]|nr:ATP-binding protein [Candidatus Didemnitutus sp.]